MSDQLKEKLRVIETRRAEMKTLFDMAKTNQVDPQTNEFIMDARKCTPEEIQRRENELAELEQEYQILKMAEIRRTNEEKLAEMYQPEFKHRIPTGSHLQYNQDGSFKTAADRFLDSVEYTRRGSNPKGHCSCVMPDFDVRDWMHPERKTLFVAANMAAEHLRLPGAVPFATRPIRVPDIIPQETTTSPFIDYFRQTASSHASAATVSESDTKTEVAIAYTLITTRLETIAAWIPVTKQSVEDQPQLRALIEGDLRNAVANEEEDQILTGNGTSPNLLGFLNAGIQSQNRGTDNNVDAIYKAFTLVRWTGFAEPSEVVIHPNNWQTIRLMKDSNNNYIWGPPSLPGPETVWGKRVVVTNAITANTALTGDFPTYSTLWRMLGLQVDISDSHSTYFVENKLAIRAEERVALVIKRPAAFSQIINLN